jgi:hypothetical protein
MVLDALNIRIFFLDVNTERSHVGKDSVYVTKRACWESFEDYPAAEYTSGRWHKTRGIAYKCY